MDVTTNLEELRAYIDKFHVNGPSTLSFPALPYNLDGTPQHPSRPSSTTGEKDGGFEDVDEDEGGNSETPSPRSGKGTVVKSRGRAKGKGKGRSKVTVGRRGRPKHAAATKSSKEQHELIPITNDMDREQEVFALSKNLEIKQANKDRKLYQNNLSARKTRVRQKITTLKQARTIRMMAKGIDFVRNLLEWSLQANLSDAQKAHAFEQCRVNPYIMRRYDMAEVSAPETDHTDTLRSYIKDLGMKASGTDLLELGGDWQWEVVGELGIPPFTTSQAENTELARPVGSDDQISLSHTLNFVLDRMPGRERPVDYCQTVATATASLAPFPRSASSRYTTTTTSSSSSSSYAAVQLKPGEEPLQPPAAVRLLPSWSASRQLIETKKHLEEWRDKQPSHRQVEARRIFEEQSRIAYERYSRNEDKYHLLTEDMAESSEASGTVQSQVQHLAVASPPATSVEAPAHGLAFNVGLAFSPVPAAPAGKAFYRDGVVISPPVSPHGASSSLATGNAVHVAPFDGLSDAYGFTNGVFAAANGPPSASVAHDTGTHDSIANAENEVGFFRFGRPLREDTPANWSHQGELDASDTAAHPGLWTTKNSQDGFDSTVPGNFSLDEWVGNGRDDELFVK